MHYRISEGDLAQMMEWEALAWTLENWETAARQALALHQRVQERFTWPKVTEAYLALYRGE
jgi:glycosyltransferase involved in cell wall biosynthesis